MLTCSVGRCSYIFGGSSQLITSIFIKWLRYLTPPVNRKGVSKICRNLMALQQNLTNIIVSQVRCRCPATPPTLSDH